MLYRSLHTTRIVLKSANFLKNDLYRTKSPELEYILKNTINSLTSSNADAVNNFKDAVNIDPKHGFSRIMLVFCLLRECDTRSQYDINYQLQMIDLLNRKSLLNEREQYFASSAYQWNKGNYLHAASLLESSLLTNPDDLIASRLSQDAYTLAGNVENVLGCILRHPSQATDDDNIYYNEHTIDSLLACGYIETGHITEAEELCLKAVTLTKGKDSYALYQLLSFFQLCGRSSEILNYIGQYAQYHSGIGLIPLLFSKGSAHLMRGNINGAYKAILDMIDHFNVNYEDSPKGIPSIYLTHIAFLLWNIKINTKMLNVHIVNHVLRMILRIKDTDAIKEGDKVEENGMSIKDTNSSDVASTTPDSENITIMGDKVEHTPIGSELYSSNCIIGDISNSILLSLMYSITSPEVNSSHSSGSGTDSMASTDNTFSGSGMDDNTISIKALKGNKNGERNYNGSLIEKDVDTTAAAPEKTGFFSGLVKLMNPGYDRRNVNDSKHHAEIAHFERPLPLTSEFVNELISKHIENITSRSNSSNSSNSVSSVNAESFEEQSTLADIKSKMPLGLINSSSHSTSKNGNNSSSDLDYLRNKISIPLHTALMSYIKEDYVECVEIFNEINPSLKHMGGSAILRDVIKQTMLEAIIRTGQLDIATSLIHERNSMVPNDAHTWRRLASIYRRQGKMKASKHAEDTAYLVGLGQGGLNRKHKTNQQQNQHSEANE